MRDNVGLRKTTPPFAIEFPFSALSPRRQMAPTTGIVNIGECPGYRDSPLIQNLKHMAESANASNNKPVALPRRQHVGAGSPLTL